MTEGWSVTETMSQSCWTPEIQALWVRLEGFQFSDEDVVFDFTARLGNENGWERAFSDRVIVEYKRFLLLAMHAGHPVTPPEAVDQAWHLHLVYTRSYWQRLCADVLGRPLHHEPTAGGVYESAKFRLQYARTLESYRLVFGTEPPADIWPGVDEAFRPKRNRWVDVSRHWTLRKPAWLRRLRSRRVVPAAAVVMLVLMIAGCREANVFDFTGPEFLRFYIAGFVMALLMSLLLVKWERSRWKDGAGAEAPNDPYEIAFLGGGGRRLVDAALTALFTRGILVARTSGAGRATLMLSHKDRTADMHPVEKRLMQSLPGGCKMEVRTVRESLKHLALEMQETLAGRGLILSIAQLARVRWLAALPMALMMVAGVIKCFIGINRDKPVFFLIFCLVFSIVILALRLGAVRKRTAAGDAAWLRVSSGGRINPVIERDGARMFDPTLAATMVALGGTAALASPSLQPLHSAIHRPGATDSGGGCGSGGCGSSGCGGGGGGGGCGGCGGD